ncbi:MAG: hypothetical protein HYZ25_12230 [Chloroflexi bacterium]|nr:hypothetical protein [Chloroflexota bacterium]
MKTIHSLLVVVLGGFALLSICAFQADLPPVQADVTPTPTYDPLVEPPLPEHPTELELGKNLYWHWCMPCHGDVGQGLTDEFRGVWEPDHQNCWARGCHAGRKEDTGFPIPTVVPAIVIADKLAQFPSLQALADFLQATHPPQHPGILQTDEYHAIAAYVFTMNDRPLEDSTPTALPTPLPTSTMSLPPSNQGLSASTSTPFLVVGGALFLIIILILSVAMRKPKL